MMKTAILVGCLTNEPDSAVASHANNHEIDCHRVALTQMGAYASSWVHESSDEERKTNRYLKSRKIVDYETAGKGYTRIWQRKKDSRVEMMANQNKQCCDSGVGV